MKHSSLEENIKHVIISTSKISDRPQMWYSGTITEWYRMISGVPNACYAKVAASIYSHENRGSDFFRLSVSDVKELNPMQIFDFQS